MPWKIDNAELKWVVIFSSVVILITTVPYLIGFTQQAGYGDFTGFIFGIDDGNSYIAKMSSGTYGAWLFQTPYTTFPQKGILAFLPYILLGKLASPANLHIQLVVLFHLFRIVAGFLSILAAYNFLSIFITEISLRRFGLILAVLGGGLGWLLILTGQTNWYGSLPLEFYSPESFGFLSLYGIPHLALSRALLLWGFVLYLRPFPQSGESWKETKRGLSIGALWLCMGFMQPLYILIGWAVCLSHTAFCHAWQIVNRLKKAPANWAVCRQYLQRTAWAILISSPLVVYSFIASSADPFFEAWTKQNLILTPHPMHYLVAYGLMLIFSVWGARKLVTLDRWMGWLPIIWIVITPFLVYSPYNLQRRLAEGIWVALVVTVVAGLEAVPVRRRIAVHVPLLLLFPSTVMLLLGGINSALKPTLPYFRPEDEVAAFQYLSESCEFKSTVLSSYETGNALPAWAPVQVLIGHGPESIGIADLDNKVKQFYQPDTTDTERLELIDDYQIDYVFWGPAEKKLGNWDPGKETYLRPIFKKGEYTIFEPVD